MAKAPETRTLLIVEDDADIQNFASRVLGMEGYCILRAGDGDTALRLLRESQVALVLLDLRLPQPDGWAVLAQIKSEPELSAISVIVFTASAGVAQRERALSLGAADYLIKPLSAASLKEAVARILPPNR